MVTRKITEVSRPGRKNNTTSTTVTRLGFSRPDRSRTEVKADGDTVLTVSDGANTLFYESSKNRYTRIVADSITPVQDSATEQGTGGHTVSKILRSETIQVDGRSYDCWVVESDIEGAVVSMPDVGVPETTLNGTVTQWIDKALLLVLQSESTFLTRVGGRNSATVKTRLTTESLKVNEPVPASAFDLTPPPGASEVSPKTFWSSGFGSNAQTLVGTKAAPFELKGVDGKAYRLADFSGKVVILDFWATWCGPCRASMPVLDDFYQKNKDRGVVVLGVNVEEESGIVAKFLQDKGVHYPVVFSAGSDMINLYRVEVYPTLVVIARDGKVTACEPGFPGASALKRMLAVETKDTTSK